MNMKSLASLTKLLLIGIVCLSTISIANAASRPDEVPKSILKEGCAPWVNWQCPAKMNCFIDLKYPKYGQCSCRQGYLQKMRPPQDLGEELAPLPHKSDCVNIGTINIVGTIIWGLMWYSWIRLLIGSILTVYRVKKNGGLKANSSSLALCLFIGVAVGEVLRHFIWTFNRAGWDPDWHFNDALYSLSDYLANQFSPWMCLECICTWFDLYQKSTSMSKRSTLLIRVLRWVLRLFALTQALVFFMIYQGSFAVGSTVYATMNNVSLWCLITCTALCGPLISRVLCKDMKDVTNPNWKAAAAIRTTGITYLVCLIMFWAAVQLLIKTGLFADQALTLNNTTIIGSFGVHLVNHWGWFHYLLFAHRRYLDTYEGSRVSNYFGFTTIGMKGSTASSFVSGKSTTASSTASSTSSVAATSSAEGEGDGKGTMA